MTHLTRWEPAREMMTLREAMDRLFDDAFTRPFSTPAIDMFETENEVVLKAALPGIKADEVQINVTEDVLTIKGEMKHEDDRNDRAWHIHEHRWGAFERSIMLPTGVSSDQAQADFESGVLTITLPKSDEVKPRTITVRTDKTKQLK